MKTLFITNRKKDIVLSLCLTLFIISLAVIITVFCKQLYAFDIDYLNITQLTGLSKEILKENYKILIQYQSLFYQGTLQLPNFIMSTTGRIHFEEVKKIFESIQIICIISGIVSMIMIYQNIQEKEYRYLKLTSFFTIAIPSMIGFLVSLDFDRAFIIFHKLFFRNNYWIFDETTDPVIMALPETFFMHCFMLIIVLIGLGSLICFGIYKRKEKDVLENH